jgi:hypothetical protein
VCSSLPFFCSMSNCSSLNIFPAFFFFGGFGLLLSHLPRERNLCVNQCKKESIPAWWERKKECRGAQSSKVLMHLHRFWHQPKMAGASRCSLRSGAKDGGGCSSSSADFSWSCNTC